MQLQLHPTGTAGEVNISLLLDGVLVAGQGFSAFPPDFQVVLAGQERAVGDSVNVVFDNLLVRQAPEPATGTILLLCAAIAAGAHRGRRP